MTTDCRGSVQRLLICLTSLLLTACSSDAPPREEAKSGDSGQTSRAALSLPADPREFLTQVVQAHGGEAALARAKIGRTKVKTVGRFDAKIEGTETESCLYRLPDRLNQLQSLETGGRKLTRLRVVNGNQGWLGKPDGTVVDLPPRAQEVAGIYPAGVLSQLGELPGPNGTLAYIRPPADRQDKEIGVRATGPIINADFFFDKQRKLLVRIVRTWPAPQDLIHVV